MSFSPRPYQADLCAKIYSAWDSGARNVVAVLPTGGGKTVVFSDIVRKHKGASCVIAHRKELVGQISVSLAFNGIRHRIIGPPTLVKFCSNLHVQEIGHASYIHPGAMCAVASIDTLILRHDSLKNWLNSVTLWVMDEAHHLLIKNKWGKGVSMFPNARGLGATATLVRADGFGLGSHTDGVFDVAVEGPDGRSLIDSGYLTGYRIYAPISDIDFSSVPISKTTGDYNKTRLRVASQKSHIVGDVVEQYLRIAPGLLGITFATDVETAETIAEKFNSSGVPAAALSAKTHYQERADTIRRFKRQELKQLVNVDLFGEGFDLPAIQVVSMARKTQSFGLYRQMFGRGLRAMVDSKYGGYWDKYSSEERKSIIAASEKPRAIIIDHVNNVDPRAGGHGLPDSPVKWSLDRREKKPKSSTSVKINICPTCTGVWDGYSAECPYCGFRSAPAVRSGPEFVDGDLEELDIAAIEKLYNNISEVDKPVSEYRAELAAKHVPVIGQRAHAKRHAVRQEAQLFLRNTIAYWGGVQRAFGVSDSESYKKFYHRFGIDVMSAQALRTDDARRLDKRILSYLTEKGALNGIIS